MKTMIPTPKIGKNLLPEITLSLPSIFAMILLWLDLRFG
jgi:hypothetical protein